MGRLVASLVREHEGFAGSCSIDYPRRVWCFIVKSLCLLSPPKFQSDRLLGIACTGCWSRMLRPGCVPACRAPEKSGHMSAVNWIRRKREPRAYSIAWGITCTSTLDKRIKTLSNQSAECSLPRTRCPRSQDALRTAWLDREDDGASRRPGRRSEGERVPSGARPTRSGRSAQILLVVLVLMQIAHSPTGHHAFRRTPDRRCRRQARGRSAGGRKRRYAGRHAGPAGAVANPR